MRWGVIGFGIIARNRFVPGLRQVEGAELVAVHHRDPDRAVALGREYGCPGYGRVEDLVADPTVEAVYIASPPHRHLAEVELAALAGKHILLEKPMGLTLTDCRGIIDATRRAGVSLLIGNMMRFNAANQAARQLIAQGAVGRVVAAQANFGFLLPEAARTWRIRSLEAGAGPLFDVGVHIVDLLRYVLGQEVAEVQAQMTDWALSQPLGGDTEDTAVLALRLTEGTLATSILSFATPGMENRLEIFGTEGMLWTENAIGQESLGRLFLRRSDRTDEVPLVTQEIYAAEIRELEDAARTGRRPLVDGEEGARALSVLLAALESARTGRPVVPEAV